VLFFYKDDVLFLLRENSTFWWGNPGSPIPPSWGLVVGFGVWGLGFGVWLLGLGCVTQ